MVPCTCRRSLRRCDARVDVCVLFNRGAEYAINRGTGRRISVDEAMTIFRESEEAGLVHTWPFALSSRLNEICNCCRDCCIIFDPGLKFGTLGRGWPRALSERRCTVVSVTAARTVSRCAFWGYRNDKGSTRQEAQGRSRPGEMLRLRGLRCGLQVSCYKDEASGALRDSDDTAANTIGGALSGMPLRFHTSIRANSPASRDVARRTVRSHNDSVTLFQ